MKIRYQVFVILCLLVATSSNAQDTFRFTNSLVQSRGFVYKRTTYDYLSNENGYISDQYLDTQYWVFTATEKPYQFQVNYYSDAKYRKHVVTKDTLKKIAPIIQFDSTGAIVSLVNWKTYRDILVSAYSKGAVLGLPENAKFDLVKDYYNSEINVRIAIIEEIGYLFSLTDDTFRTEAEYIRMRQFMTPFNKIPYFVQGKLYLERKNDKSPVIEVFQKHRAGPAEKQILREEIQNEMKRRAEKGSLVEEITGTDMNSEYHFYYNLNQHRFYNVELQDVFVINKQSRGNNRYYRFVEAW